MLKSEFPLDRYRNKPNIRWNGRSEWAKSKCTKIKTTNLSKNTVQSNADPSISQEDIFQDSSVNAGEQDDDGFTSDDCISLNALLDKEE